MFCVITLQLHLVYEFELSLELARKLKKSLFVCVLRVCVCVYFCGHNTKCFTHTHARARYIIVLESQPQHQAVPDCVVAVMA